MIYITRNQNTTIITDSFVDYIPDYLDIYLDDALIGTYANISTTTLYMKWVIPVADINSYQEREYNMKIVNHGATIKQELVIVKDYTSETNYTITENKEIIFYE